MWIKLVFLAVGIGASLAELEPIVVQVEQGPVRGYSDANGEVFSFLNIPYATAPTGSNKYKAPLPAPTWTEPYDVTDKVITCYQPSFAGVLPANISISMVEDCLVANIFIPHTTATNLPVMVHIHGGAYQIGVGFTYRFDSLVRTQKVIVVTFNYRLGVPGFLCLGTEDVPGNAGMKDQVALLRWVNRNIARFGGNPDDVTIYGCSAGGASVDFLTLSPIANGLFKKAIPESAATSGVASAQTDPVANAKLYAKYLNFDNVDNLTALEDFYKTVSYELLLSGLDFIITRDDSTLLFAPCVERDTGTGEEKFIAEAPWAYLNNRSYNNVPILYGFADMEGLYQIPLFDIYKDRMNEKFSDFLPGELYFESETEKEKVAARVQEFYFGNRNVSEETVLAYIDYFTDIMFAYPVLRAANLKASHNDTVYLFEYSFVDENTPLIPHTTLRGANHCQQLGAIADDDLSTLFPSDHTEEFLALRETMRGYWLNFITTGNPTPEGSSLPSWQAVDGFLSPYIALNRTISLEQSTLMENRVRLWDSIYEEYYRLPVSPSAA